MNDCTDVTNNVICDSTIEMFCMMTDRLLLSISTRCTVEAPREAASIPTEPLPEKRSKNEQSLKSPRMANKEVLIRSIAGLISPGGHLIVLPQYRPPVILIASDSSYGKTIRLQEKKYNYYDVITPSIVLRTEEHAATRS